MMLLSEAPPKISAAAIYHFLNFSFVPSPHSLIVGVEKVPSASIVEVKSEIKLERYWMPQYGPKTVLSDGEAEVALFRATRDSVRKVCPNEDQRWGAFLSGGTDSSSIAGHLAALCTQPPKTFSIGFEEPEFNELDFARAAVDRYKLSGIERVISAEDGLGMLGRLLTQYDEPTGNASSLPTLSCLEMARDSGVQIMVAGDGGDEIFGGNERYRKDQIMQKFYELSPVLRRMAGVTARISAPVNWRPVNRFRNFVRRASLPNPERFYTDDAFASEHFDALLGPALRDAVMPDSSLSLMRAVYSRCTAPDEIDRLMALDLALAISENDLVKVNRAARSLGIAVRFPYLDEELVQFAGQLRADQKIRGREKRYLFRRAMRGFLPDVILDKRKQGFGLPVGVWFKTQSAFRELIGDVLLGKKARERGYFDPKFVRNLYELHLSGQWDHSAEIWYLLQLELWLSKHVDRQPGL
jgi:asparagine synthase (glutamine-hydrolysing)